MIRTPSRFVAAMLSLVFSAGAIAANNPEVEPNNTKAQATLCNSGGLGMDIGDTITGTTTGSSGTAGATSSDYFLVQTKARALGIYRYRLAFTSAVAGHTISIRGLSQTGGVVTAGTDAGIQNHSSALVTGARSVQWYGFGRQERIYVKVTGTTTTTAQYTGTLSVDAVVPTDVSGVVDGTVTIKKGTATATPNADIIVMDSALNPVPGFLFDEPDATGLVRDFTAGTYYVAFGTFNTCNDQPSPSDDTRRTGSVTDFPNVLVNTDTTSIAQLDMLIQTDAGDNITSFTRTSPYDINFARVPMAINNIALPPRCSVAISPNSVLNDGTGNYALTVTVTPGRRPASSTHLVTCDLSLLGDTRPQPVVLVESSPNTFTTDSFVADGTTTGAYQLTVNVQETSPLSRSTTCTVNLTVASPPVGACCTNDGCMLLTQRNCNTQGGLYQGNGTTCTGCTCAGTEPPSNDTCSAPVTLTVNNPVVGNTCAASIQTIPTCSGMTSTSGGLWYKFIGTGNSMTLDTCQSPTATGFNTRISVFCGSDCSSFTCVAGADNSATCANNQAGAVFCTQANAQYLALVHGTGTARGDFVVMLSDSGSPCDATVRCIPTGGCCLATGCQDVTAAECATLGGNFLGLGVNCVTRTQNPGRQSTDTPVQIPDLGVADATINVPAGQGNVQDLVVSMGLTHTFVGDLIGTLTSPNGTAVILFTREGGAPNLAGDYAFADSGAVRLGGTGLTATNDVIPSGTYLPAQSLSAFNGQPYQGQWLLHITDNAGQDIGSVDSFLFVDVTVTSNCGGGCAPCAADYNQDGGIDGSDIAAFFPDWEASTTCADVNQDGGVDGSDIESFFRVWQAGGC
jgi:subtilisin-like proprotein convertase family protein